jgi:hypothetical protein
MPDALEAEYETDPANPDSDGDGFLDLEEFTRKSNPLDDQGPSVPIGTAPAVRAFIFTPTPGIFRTIKLGASVYLPAGALSQVGTFSFGFTSQMEFTEVLNAALVSNDITFAPGTDPGSLLFLFSLPMTLPTGVGFPSFSLAAGGSIGGTLAKDSVYVDTLGGVPGTYEIVSAASGGGPASAAFRPISPAAAPAGATFGNGCVLTMQAGGSSNGYVVVEVTDADCEPFPGYCVASDCEQKLGSAHLIFDLLGVVGG